MTPQTRQMTSQVMITRLRSVTQGRNITQEQLNTVIIRPGAASGSSVDGAVSLEIIFIKILSNISIKML